jgi:DNA polymerase III alpha subunit
LATHRCGQITELEEGTAVKLAGLIANLRAITTKRGDRMASLVLEDLSGQAACTVFAATYAKLKDLLEKDKVVCVSGIVTHRERTINGGERQVEVRVEDLAPVEAGESATFDDDESTEGTVVIRVGRATRDQLLALRRLIEDTPGDYGVVVQLGAGAEAPPLRLLRHVGADEAFFDKARRTVAQCEIEVIRRASLVSNGFEAEEMLA